MSDLIDNETCKDALRRIARTAEGRLFYIALQKVLMGVPSDTKRGALRENLGRRKLASELMAVMAEAMSESTSGGTGDPNERPIVFSLASPVAVAGGTRGARRRVADTRGEPPAGE